MIDPRSCGAVPIDGLPVVLTHVRDLEDFEGPLLAEFATETGDTYLYHWCDREGVVTRWIVMRTPRQDLNRYLVGAATLRDLIEKCHDQFVYLIDLDPDDQVRATFFIAVDHLPNDYLPSPQSHYQASVATRDVQADGRHQDVFIDDQWGDEQIALYPRRYLQAYAFTALFGRDGDPSAVGTIAYRLTTGWVFNTLFHAFRASAPSEKQASLDSVAVASPGYVRFKVHPLIAANLRHAIARYMTERATVDGLRYQLGRWAIGHEPKVSEEWVKSTVARVGRIIGLRSGDLLKQSDNLVIAVKALTSYVNKLAFLADKEEKRTAMLVGLKRVKEASSSGDSPEDEAES